MMSDAEVDELTKDIREHGLQHGLVFWTPDDKQYCAGPPEENFLIDGRNRLLALERAFDDPGVREASLKDARRRRHEDSRCSRREADSALRSHRPLRLCRLGQPAATPIDGRAALRGDRGTGEGQPREVQPADSGDGGLEPDDGWRGSVRARSKAATRQSLTRGPTARGAGNPRKRPQPFSRAQKPATCQRLTRGAGSGNRPRPPSGTRRLKK
jgi:hypothetical protein